MPKAVTRTLNSPSQPRRIELRGGQRRASHLRLAPTACERSVRNKKVEWLGGPEVEGKSGHTKTNSLLTMFVFDWTQHLAGPNRNAADGLA